MLYYRITQYVKLSEAQILRGATVYIDIAIAIYILTSNDDIWRWIGFGIFSLLAILNYFFLRDDRKQFKRAEENLEKEFDKLEDDVFRLKIQIGTSQQTVKRVVGRRIVEEEVERLR